MKLFGKKDIGNRGERIAARYLKKQGFRILARNCFCGKNELDLVAKNKECIAFVEVKTLTFETTDADRRPARAVDMAKRRRTVAAARDYLRMHPTRLCPRLDVVEVYLDRKSMKPFKINHIPSAFAADGTIY